MNNRDIKKYSIIAALGAFTIWLGFGETQAEVVECRSFVKKHVDADFSELKTESNMEGDLETYTDSWEELASEIHTAYTVNGKLIDSTPGATIHQEKDYGYFFPLVPPHDSRMQHMPHFDRFSEQRTSWLKVVTIADNEQDIFTEPVEDTAKCLGGIGETITVKWWYFWSYGTDWS